MDEPDAKRRTIQVSDHGAGLDHGGSSGGEALWFGLETLATRMDAPAVTPRATGLFNAIVAKVRTFK